MGSHALNAGHLARRFFGMLVPLGPRAADERWVAATLLAGELALWRRMRRADRRHAAAVSRRVERALGHQASRPVLAAALLHDVGKLDAGLGAYGRVIATLCGMVASPDTVRGWTATRGFTRRIGLYLQHPRLGAEMLALAGSDPLTVTWAREHHQPPESWSLPPEIALVLKDADDD